MSDEVRRALGDSAFFLLMLTIGAAAGTGALWDLAKSRWWIAAAILTGILLALSIAAMFGAIWWGVQR